MTNAQRYRPVTVRLTPDQAERQGRVSRLALQCLVDPKAAIAFLNTHHVELGGRPLDIAISGPVGMASAEAVLVALRAG